MRFWRLGRHSLDDKESESGQRKGGRKVKGKQREEDERRKL